MGNTLLLTSSLLLAVLSLLLAESSMSVAAFLPSQSSSASRILLPRQHQQPVPSNVLQYYNDAIPNQCRFPARTTTARIQRQRSSMATTQLRLFGLGLAEIVIILVGIAVVLGPEKLGEMVRSSSDTAKEYQQELSKIPDEFQKGMAEGEIDARARKAKPMRKVVVEKSHSQSDASTEDE